MPVVVGIDGGNTKTVALVCDLEGEVRGLGRGGSSNWEGIGVARAAACITEVVEQALAMAGRTRADLVWMHGGLAGLDWPEDVPRLRDALCAAGWTCGISLENDAFSGIRATAPGGHGIGVNAGTGVASGLIRPDGETFFYGAFTDLGGGFETSSRTFQAVVRAHDGRGPATALTPAVLQATGQTTVLELVHAVHRETRQLPGHQVLRPVLFSVAAQGDAVAVEIVTDFAAQLALCATNLVRRYHLAREPIAVVAAGSLFQKTGPLLFTRFSEFVRAEAPRAELILSDHPPLMGAVRGALRGCGHNEPACWERLNRSARTGRWFSDEALDTSQSGI